MAYSALLEGRLCGSTQHSRTAQGLVLTTSGGSTSIFKQTTSAAFVVFTLFFDFQDDSWESFVCARDGFPQERCRLAQKWGPNDPASSNDSVEGTIRSLAESLSLSKDEDPDDSPLELSD